MTTAEKKAIDRTRTAIVSYFNKAYGFAPAKINIVPLETVGSHSDGFEWIDTMTFRVGSIEYFWDGKTVTKSEC